MPVDDRTRPAPQTRRGPRTRRRRHADGTSLTGHLERCRNEGRRACARGGCACARERAQRPHRRCGGHGDGTPDPVDGHLQHRARRARARRCPAALLIGPSSNTSCGPPARPEPSVEGWPSSVQVIGIGRSGRSRRVATWRRPASAWASTSRRTARSPAAPSPSPAWSPPSSTGRSQPCRWGFPTRPAAAPSRMGSASAVVIHRATACPVSDVNERCSAGHLLQRTRRSCCSSTSLPSAAPDLASTSNSRSGSALDSGSRRGVVGSSPTRELDSGRILEHVFAFLVLGW